MQDKPHSDFDPRLMDQGWELLRPQLDEVLPVADERRRRLVFWWWLALGLLLFATGVGAAYWIQEEPTPEMTELPPMASTALPATENTATSRTQASVRAAKSSNTNIEEQESRQEAIATTTQAQTINTPVTDVDPIDEQVTIADSSATSLLASTEGQATQKSSPVPSLEEKTGSINSLTEVLEEDFSSAPRSVSSLAALPTLLPTQVDELAGDVADIAQATIAVKAPHQVNYYLSTRTSTSLSEPHFSSWGIGLGGEVSLSRSWRLATTLSYHETWPKRLHAGLWQSNDELFAGGIDEEVSEDIMGQYNLSSPLLYKLYTRQLGLELRALLRLSPRWQLAMGGELLYYQQAFLRESVTVSNVGSNSVRGNFNFYDNDVQVIYDNAGGLNSPGTGAEETIALNPRRWQGAVVAGLQYQLAPRWQLGLDWRKQFSPWSNALPNLQTQSTLQLRLNYRLR